MPSAPKSSPRSASCRTSLGLADVYAVTLPAWYGSVAKVSVNGKIAGYIAAPFMGVAADRIGAPTYDELTQPLDEVPVGASPFAFRTNGPWD